MIGTNNTDWATVKDLWSEYIRQDEVTQHDGDGKAREKAALRRTEISNDLQDWLVGSLTSQDTLRATYIGLSELDKKAFAKIWKTVLNERDYPFERFHQECFPVAVLRQQRDRINELSELTTNQKDQLDMALQTVTARDRSLSDAETNLKTLTADRDRFKELARKHSEGLTQCGSDLQAANETIEAQDLTILRLKARLFDLQTDLSLRLVNDRNAAGDEGLAEFQRINCLGCRYSDRKQVGTGKPCCTKAGAVEQEEGVCKSRVEKE